eukprot:TRINITY_DN6356_c0_g4_i2.p1 TRINITY_DN6356_c0_g4~~TRINITY_DN6356_c0_g4_i2.p1  ORF type:complete len:154 (-),score=18.35 TRINITY_DN6356_c0_g4_i2:119-580(-)
MCEASARVSAIVCSGLFAGAAMIISAAEHPSRYGIGDAAFKQFQISYPRAAKVQASLALIGGLSGIVAYRCNKDIKWLVGGLLFTSVVPFTLVCILPTNKQLLASSTANPQTIGLLQKWGWFHLVRTTVSLTSFIIFILTNNKLIFFLNLTRF